MNRFVKFLLNRVGGMYENWLSKRSDGYVFPQTVEIIRDVPYRNDGKACHRMDVYRPKDFAGKLPVIVNLHGGGLVLCTKEVNVPFCAELAERGFLVFCVDYPLAPEATVPRMLEDVCAGLDRVSELLVQYGGDPDQVFLTGDSAGAFLSVYAVAVRRNPAIAEAAGVRPSKLEIKALGLINGMFHTAECDETGFFLRKDFYGKQWRNHPLRPYLKPEREEVASLMPPTFLVTGKADKLRKSTIRFYRGLECCGIHCRLMDFPVSPKLSHDFTIMYPQMEESQEVLEEMTGFFCKKINH